MKDSTQKTSTGRPRGFDTEKALDGAMRVFWQKGFDGASLTDLTDAMGINRPSMYAAFGNKEELYSRTMERYVEARSQHLGEYLGAATARESVELVLRDAAMRFTDPNNPNAGCFGMQGAMTCADVSPELKEHIEDMHVALEKALRQRFSHAINDGELPPGSAADLARFYAVIYQGLAFQAKAGTGRKELYRVVDMALKKWPRPPSKSSRAPSAR
jgi:AcrR family transcriptional regulator